MQDYTTNIYKNNTFKFFAYPNISMQMSKTITINVAEEVESEFRKEASRKYGKRKGYLGRAITEAMKEWTKKRNEDLENQVRQLIKEGVKMKKWKFNREELHER